MKKLLWIVIIMLLSAANVSAYGLAQVEGSILRYEPTPAEQGNTVDVWVQLSNKGTQADNVAIKFVPEYPFSLAEGQQQEVDLGLLAASEDVVEKFTVFIAPDAPNGERDIRFDYKYFTQDAWVTLESPITIETQDVSLVIENYKITPSPVMPGQVITAELTLKNEGKFSVKNIDVNINLANHFSTVGTGTKKRIDSIAPGESESVTFELASDTSTEVKLYSLPVILSYQDERNKEYEDTASISLIVNAEPELSLTVDSTEFDSRRKPGTVSLKVVNKGVVDLKYMTVLLKDSSDYEILSSSNEAYVGNLDSDDFETVDFIVKPNVKMPLLNVEMEFRDSYNRKFHERYDLPLRIITPSDLGKGGISFGLVIVVLAAIGGTVYWWRKKRKK